jgi:hypothetical protein
MTHSKFPFSKMVPNSSHDPILAVVVGDFSREATLRFWTHVSALEYRHIRSMLPPGSAFYDEYRRITYCLLGDLPFIKQSGLRTRQTGLLDDRILIGFPGGITINDVLPRVGLLIFHALWGPSQRDIRNVWVMFPCNTLAPLCWELEKIFHSPEDILEMVAAAGCGIGDAERILADKIVERIQPVFPTIPEAVIEYVWACEKSALIPLGTLDIVQTYTEALRRLRYPLQLIAPDPHQQAVVLQSIKSCICAEAGERKTAKIALSQIVDQLIRIHGNEVAVIQACTDLTCGIGLDSNAIFAESMVKSIYR